MASLGTFKIPQPVRDALGYLAFVSYLTDLQVNMPELPIKELENVKNGLMDYDKYIQEAKKFIAGKAQMLKDIAELKIQLEPEFIPKEVKTKPTEWHDGGKSKHTLSPMDFGISSLSNQKEAKFIVVQPNTEMYDDVVNKLCKNKSSVFYSCIGNGAPSLIPSDSTDDVKKEILSSIYKNLKIKRFVDGKEIISYNNYNDISVSSFGKSKEGIRQYNYLAVLNKEPIYVLVANPSYYKSRAFYYAYVKSKDTGDCYELVKHIPESDKKNYDILFEVKGFSNLSSLQLDSVVTKEEYVKDADPIVKIEYIRVNPKSILGKLSPDEIEAKRTELKKLQTELKEFDFKKNMMDAQKEKLDNLKKELQDIIESQKEQYKKEIEKLKDNFLKKPAPGAETINKLCDDIENDINQIIDGIKALIIIISMLIAKIPTPGAIGACVTSPPYAIEQCMTDLKQAMEVLMKLIAFIMDIIAKLKLLKVDKAGEIVEKIKGTDAEQYLPPPIVALIEWLRGLCKKYEDQVNDMQQQVEDAQRKAKKGLEENLAPVYEETDDEESQKIIAYKNPLLNDDLSLMGWRYYKATRGRKGRNLQQGSVGNNTVYGNRVYYWWYDVMNDDITLNTDPKTVEDGENMASASVVNSNIKNADIDATVIEYNGKHYLIDSSAKSGDVIKLPNGAGFVKLQ